MPPGRLYDYANTFVGQRISIIEGVAQVIVYGSASAVRAQIDPGMIANMGISAQEISNALQTSNQYQPLGQFDGDYASSTIYDNGAVINADSYDPLIMVYRNGAPVRLRDVATVIDSRQNDRSFRRYIDNNINQPSVTLAVQRQPGANAVEVAKNVQALLNDVKSQTSGGFGPYCALRSLNLYQGIYSRSAIHTGIGLYSSCVGDLPIHGQYQGDHYPLSRHAHGHYCDFCGDLPYWLYTR